jgi:hypothetical protein
MLQAISDIKEPLEENQENGELSFKVQKEILMKRFEEKLDQIN